MLDPVLSPEEHLLSLPRLVELFAARNFVDGVQFYRATIKPAFLPRATISVVSIRDRVEMRFECHYPPDFLRLKLYQWRHRVDVDEALDAIFGSRPGVRMRLYPWVVFELVSVHKGAWSQFVYTLQRYPPAKYQDRESICTDGLSLVGEVLLPQRTVHQFRYDGAGTNIHPFFFDMVELALQCVRGELALQYLDILEI